MSIELTSLNLRLPSSWRPKTLAQWAALNCPAEVLLFGGAAGSLKSTTMLIAAAQQIDNPRYQAIIFRKTIPELRFLMRRSIELYTQMGATLRDFNQTSHTWKFPSGAIIEFAYLDKDKDIYKRQGDAFSFMGFDESTQFPQEHVRYLINSRGRTTDSSIKQQVFFATNPGNVGHNWHKNMFIGPKCTHCLKAPMSKTRIPGQMYGDAAWLDGVPLGMTTMFIPGLVTDHDLFGKGGGDYANKKLRGLTKAMCKALLEGCWEAFEGMYFDIWTPEVHVIDEAEMSKLYRPWWTSWISTDYGMAHAAASYLFHKDENSHVYTAQEHVAHRVNASNYAIDVWGLWRKYNPKAWYASPDLRDKDGSSEDDVSRMEMMSRATGYTLTPAYNSRVAGWSMCYTGLQSTVTGTIFDVKTKEPIRPAGGITISSACELLVESIPTRIHDDGAQDGGRNKARKEDVKKTPDDEDDAADGWRYGIATEMQQAEKTLQQIAEEKMKDIKDPTVAMIARRAAEYEYSKASAPIPYTGRARTR